MAYYEFVQKQVINRLRSRLTLGTVPNVIDPMVVGKQIIPTLSVDDILADRTFDDYVKAVSAVTGYDIWTVPDGKRWEITAFSLYLSTGNWSIDRVALQRSGTVAVMYYESLCTNVSINPCHWFLDAGQTLRVYVDVMNVAGNAILGIAYKEFSQDASL